MLKLFSIHLAEPLEILTLQILLFHTHLMSAKTVTISAGEWNAQNPILKTSLNAEMRYSQ